jgi:hypothetical protein
MSLYTKIAANSEALTGRQRSLQNLKPWPKGVSGNPEGRPPKSLYQTELEKNFNDPAVVERLVAASVQAMCDGKGMAGVLERKHNKEWVDGPITQEMNVNLNLSMADMLSAARKRIAESSGE